MFTQYMCGVIIMNKIMIFLLLGLVLISSLILVSCSNNGLNNSDATTSDSVVNSSDSPSETIDLILDSELINNDSVELGDMV